mmetsp:Transcript_19163/g.34673  ORF Transcript_19163/g.34673 Transcript_19163/m.34673 type:complete len:265 (-) Transcript_19163:795-1589(-)|eukprot:CAMPEP_0175041190 /NCGR_PEP_ID=MMETSP0052_2-20121109/1769_1 /TAXON_ID=51329 ORGANISM="Polytomella parva, Strain SAG 63-3" /NCGR_SAMPLE_ID=MMETSP0052_2 /ASSEMBLY_ACC=CAM_ASM_000194 /LENGTH=264 /DNA_ID=CAMNT_0016303661 /DNA_START=26 /DNA_END=820 /DNA_ORIENTATION=-
MAASFWNSASANLLVSKQRILENHQEDKLLGLTSKQIKQLEVYFASAIVELARDCRLCQRVAATAVLYFRRVYLSQSFAKLDPRILFAGCLYLSAKAEESHLSAKHIADAVLRRRLHWPYDSKDILDAEMVIMEELDFNLRVFHAHSDLSPLLRAAGLERSLGQLAWAAANDTCRTDAPLMYPPYTVAIGCICVAAEAANVDITPWLEKLEGVAAAGGVEQVYGVVQELMDLYAAGDESTISAAEAEVLLDQIQFRRQKIVLQV